MAEHKKWTPEEDAELERLYAEPSLQLKDIVDTVGRHRNQVIRRAKKLGLVLASSVQWPEADDQLLIDHVGVKGILWCAKQLDRSEEAVRMRARRLGLKTADARSNIWTKEEDGYIVEKRQQGVGFQEIGEALGRTQEATRYRHKVIRGVISKRSQPEEGKAPPAPKPARKIRRNNDADEPGMETGSGAERVLVESYIRHAPNPFSEIHFSELCAEFGCSEGEYIDRLAPICGDALQRHRDNLPPRQGWSAIEKQFVYEYLNIFHPYELQRVLLRSEESIVRLMRSIATERSRALPEYLRTGESFIRHDFTESDRENMSADLFILGCVKNLPATLIARLIGATYKDLQSIGRKRLNPDQYKSIFGRRMPPSDVGGSSLMDIVRVPEGY